MKYPKHHYDYLFSKILKIKQDDYATTNEYNTAIEKGIEKIAISGKYTKKEREKRRNEIFLMNLSFKSKIEMKKLKLTKVKDIVKEINEYEKLLIEEALKNNDVKPINYNANENFRSNFTKSSKKYFRYHKTSFHDSSECNA